MFKVLNIFIIGLMFLEVKSIVKNFRRLLQDFKRTPERNHLVRMYFDVYSQELL